jgi:molybdopterin-guanine dinucleotide biosynthesis protein A
VDGVSAFVLAGGRSSRMGANKALLKLGEVDFLTLALRNALEADPGPVIVGDASLYAAYGHVVEDQFRGCGPLGGIHAALASSKTRWNLVLSVDMPLMSGAFLPYLADVALKCNQNAVVPKIDGQVQPLCAVYRREILPVVERALQAGRYKVEPLLSDVGTRFVLEDEMMSAGFAMEIFRNVNTPEDYEWVKQYWLAGEVRD